MRKPCGVDTHSSSNQTINTMRCITLYICIFTVLFLLSFPTLTIEFNSPIFFLVSFVEMAIKFGNIVVCLVIFISHF